MTPSLLFTAFLLLASLGFWQWRRGRRSGNDAHDSKPSRGEAVDTVTGWPPEPTRLLTATERRAMQMLQRALPEHLVFAQVPLARFIRVPTRNSYTEWMRRVGQVCADLLVCDTSSEVIAVVELRRPPGKDTERTRKRHERMDRVLRKAGIRVLVWNEEALPPPDVIRDQVLPPTKTAEPLSAPMPLQVQPSPAPAIKPVSPVVAKSPFEDTEPQPDEVFELREPLASTWFAEFDSGRVPLETAHR